MLPAGLPVMSSQDQTTGCWSPNTAGPRGRDRLSSVHNHTSLFPIPTLVSSLCSLPSVSPSPTLLDGQSKEQHGCGQTQTAQLWSLSPPACLQASSIICCSLWADGTPPLVHLWVGILHRGGSLWHYPLSQGAAILLLTSRAFLSKAVCKWMVPVTTLDPFSILSPDGVLKVIKRAPRNSCVLGGLHLHHSLGETWN